MGVQQFLKAALKASMPVFDEESITIGGSTFGAIIDETASRNELGKGASLNERTLVVQFPADSYTGALKSGQFVTARGLQWQIDANDPGAVRRGQIATTLVLVEPERGKQ